MFPTLKNLSTILFDEENAKKLILESLNSRVINTCPEDGSALTKIEDFRYKCNKKSHRKIYSIFKDTIFENKTKKFSEIILVIYLWCTKSKQDAIIKMTGHSDETISKIFNKLKALIYYSLKDDDMKIGGEGVVVELDESKFGKRKYNRGHRVEGAWVFGGVERTPERCCFLFVVEKRDAATLNEIIKKCVLPGSIIITDGWKEYNFL